MINQKIVCRRADSSIEFSNSSPYLLLSADGLTETKFTVDTQKNAGQDGESYTGSSAEKRNIFITADITSDYLKKKDFLFSFFTPRSQGVLYYTEGSVTRKIGYYTESVSASFTGVLRTVSISLICPDPRFQALEDERYTTAIYTKKVRWPLLIPNSGRFEVTSVKNGDTITIQNPTGTTYGMTVIFTAQAPAAEVGLENLTTGERFSLSAAMASGDRITVTTGYGNKRVSLLSGGSEKNINNLWNYGSDWLQVPPGTSTFQLIGDKSSVTLDISVTPTYWGT